MGIWSSIKKAAKKVVRAVKAAVRVAFRIPLTFFSHLVDMYDLLFGFLAWPSKNLTLHVVILTKPADNAARKKIGANVQLSIDEARRILRDRFNIKLRPYGAQYIEFFEGPVPTDALNPSCCGTTPFWQEFGIRGDFYAKHLAGWNGIPISLRFPVTVFIVDTMQCRNGCSLGPLSDYVVVTHGGLDAGLVALPHSLMVHEIGHACSLPHLGSSQPYLMWGPKERGDKVHGWQMNLLRSSRHVTYW